MNENDRQLKAQLTRQPDPFMGESRRGAVLDSQVKDAVARSASSISSLVQGDSEQVFDEVAHAENSDMMRDAISTQARLAMRSQSREQGVQEAMEAETPEQGEQALRNAEARETAINGLEDDPFAPQKIEAYAEAAPGTDEVAKMQYALDTAMQEDLYRTLQDVGMVETVADFATMVLVPGRTTHNLSQVLDTNWLDTFWNAEGDINTAIRNFRSLPPERQQNVWTQMKTQILDEMGPSEGAALLSQFFNPAGEGGDYSKLWLGIDVADSVSTAAGFAIGAAGVAARANKIRRLGEMGSNERAAQITSDALTDQTGRKAREAGISRETAAHNAEPTKDVERLNSAAYTDAAAEVQNRIYQAELDTRRSLNQVFEDTPTVPGFSREAGDYDRAIGRREDAFTEELTERFEVTDVTTETVGHNTFRTTANIFNPVTGKRSRRKKTWHMTLDDNSEYRTTLNDKSLLGANSPRFIVRGNGLATEDIFRATDAENITTAAGNRLTEQVQRINKVLRGNTFTKRRKRNKVNDVLLQGDEYIEDGREVGKVFDYTTLRQRFHLGDDEIEYYYAMRQVQDTLGLKHNEIMRNQMVLRNIKDIRLGTTAEGEAIRSYGRVYDDVETARGSLQRRNSRDYDVSQMYNTETKEVVQVRDIDLDSFYDSGLRMVEVENPVRAENGGSFTHILTRADNVSELPQQVLRTRPGYIARSYKKGVYATTMVRRGMLNGQEGKIIERKTLNLYDNVYEQEEHLDTLLAAKRDEGYNITKAGGGGEWELQSLDRAGASSNFTEMAENAGGRLYTSPRASNAIPFGSDAAKAERLDPIESLHRQLGAISSQLPRHEQRITMLNRLEKLAASRNIPFDARRPVPATSEFHKFLEQQRQNYVRFASLQTGDESALARRARSRYEWMVGVDRVNRESRKARLAWHLTEAEPIQRIRTATFHMMLGFFNPAQLWVQAQGGVIAMSVLPPTRAHAVGRGMYALGVGGATRSDDIGGAALGRALGTSAENGNMLYREYRKTGFDDSVNANADVKQVEAGFADPMSVFQSAKRKSTVFYAMGERFNKRISWLTSLEKYMTRNKIKDYKNLTEADFQKIRNQSNTYMLNMHAQNRANWQEGVLSIPTQFLQVQAKFMEEMLNFDNGWTKWDRARVILGQLALYGGASVPFVGRDAAGLVGQVLGMSEEEAAQSSLLQKGIIQTALRAIGADTAIATRSAVMAGMEQLYASIFERGSADELLTGPSNVTGVRLYDGLRSFIQQAGAMAGNGQFDPLVYGQIALDEIAGLTSTYTNYQKMRIYQRANAIVDSYGLEIAKTTWLTNLLQGMGFQPGAVERLWEMRSDEYADRDLEKKGLKRLVELNQDYLSAMESGNEALAEAKAATIHHVYETHFQTLAARNRAAQHIATVSREGGPTLEEQKLRDLVQSNFDKTIAEINPYLEDE